MYISLSNINTTYRAWLNATAQVADAQAVITAAGPRPAYPVIVTTDDSYNNITAAQEAWDASNSTLQAHYEATLRDLNKIERNVAFLLPPSQWVNLVSTSTPAYNVYVGCLPSNNTFNVVTSIPTQPFPSL